MLEVYICFSGPMNAPQEVNAPRTGSYVVCCVVYVSKAG